MKVPKVPIWGWLIAGIVGFLLVQRWRASQTLTRSDFVTPPPQLLQLPSMTEGALSAEAAQTVAALPYSGQPSTLTRVRMHYL